MSHTGLCGPHKPLMSYTSLCGPDIPVWPQGTTNLNFPDAILNFTGVVVILSPSA
jgi:hypothetical protein